MYLTIDADQWLYACGFAAQGEPVSHAIRLLQNKLKQTYKDCGTADRIIYIAGRNNFRDDISFDYKANRVSDKPDHYPYLREYLEEHEGAVVVNNWEADDQVSMDLWTDYVYHSGNPDRCSVILVSPDKDLNNTPGWHYNPTKREKYWVSESQADRHFHFQLLAGDPVDNIKGLQRCSPLTMHKHGLSKASLKGCGKASAKKIMASPETYLEDVYEAYILTGLELGYNKEEVLSYLTDQGQLLWMLRELNHFELPVMWGPDEEVYDEIYDRVTSSKSKES